MRVLILRTFVHTLIWESGYNHCTYYKNELEDDILCWEPDFLDFNIKQFRYALGVYMGKYFSYVTSTNNVVFQNTENEQIISLLKLIPYVDTSSFINYLKDKKDVEVYYEYIGKLWKEPDRELMSKIDQSLIREKIKELKNNHGAIPMPSSIELSLRSSSSEEVYYPLSFSLDELVVESVLGRFDIDLKQALDLI